MKSKLLNLLSRHILSPWWIFSLDVIHVIVACLVVFLLRMNFQLPINYVWNLMGAGLVVVGVYVLSFLVMGSYRGVIRFTNFHDLVRYLTTCFLAVGILLIGDVLNHFLGLPWIQVPHLLIVLHFMLALFLGLGFRMVVREFYTYLTRSKGAVNTLIFGAGDLGLLTLEGMLNDRKTHYQVIGFVDDNPSKWNMYLRNIPVYSWEKALRIGHRKEVDVVVLAISSIPVSRKREISDQCLKMNWKLKIVPSIGHWVDGTVSPNKIRDIKIEDLLGRDEIKLDQDRIRQGLEGKTVLVSGAAGSIGSEIVRHLLNFPVEKIVLLDQAESELYNLQQELLAVFSFTRFELVLGDVSNYIRMRRLFERVKPQVVFNAAAYKHVPLMEANPYEAIRVNVGGTKIMADLAVEFKTEKFVMVSTDKAVNPTNVMGASKRISEIYIQALSQIQGIGTSFVTTRFGNVLGSNGSVVPLFKQQIEQGGPITVTHPDITRYFMTIPEACQLVLEAGFMGKGGEIFVFDMGEPVKIDDLARKMICLAGLRLDKDIKIKYTGLRPGEKLFEELLATPENTLPTHNEKIMIGRVRMYPYTEVNSIVSRMLKELNETTNEQLVSQMKHLVPEFVSHNSEYSRLDKVYSRKKIYKQWKILGGPTACFRFNTPVHFSHQKQIFFLNATLVFKRN